MFLLKKKENNYIGFFKFSFDIIFSLIENKDAGSVVLQFSKDGVIS